MKIFLVVFTWAVAVILLGGCVDTPPSQANETPGPALQSAYCIQHPNEPRCLR
jgi:hypothetical protein